VRNGRVDIDAAIAEQIEITIELDRMLLVGHSGTDTARSILKSDAKSGLVVLTSDVCYLKENLDKDILPSVGLTYDPTRMLDAYHYIKQAIDRKKGDVIFAHNPHVFKAHRHSPEFYE
jgi:hypothetical protein